MSDLYSDVCDIISEHCAVQRDALTPETNLLDFDILMADAAFGIDKAFGVRPPVIEWAEKVENGEICRDDYFRLDAFVARVEEMRRDNEAQ